MNAQYKRLTASFKEWLGILGYVPGSVESMPSRIAELFSWLEANNIYKLDEITKQHIHSYYQSLKTKKSKFTGELLKNSTLNGIIRIFNLFNQYLEETNQGRLVVELPYEQYQTPEREILTKAETEALYNAADESILGLRDRAILSIYYGCGLRSKEGIYLDVSDILLDKKLLYVRKGKKYKERYVPFVKSQRSDFKHYLKECRNQLVKNNAESSFLVNNQGTRIGYSTLNRRIKILKARAGITKTIGLHSLRHSIATHLLQSGMAIEDIATFLGHKQISSTQRYTHIVNEYEF